MRVILTAVSLFYCSGYKFDKINTNLVPSEDEYEDGDYYYAGEDGTSEVEAHTVTSVDADEYYDYQDYDDIVNNRRNTVVRSPEILTPSQGKNTLA